jgi:hypothetical protein
MEKKKDEVGIVGAGDKGEETQTSTETKSL